VVESAGGRVLAGPFDIPVGRAAAVEDPFGNVPVILDMSKGRYVTDPPAG
jgi:predicted enzyme related to lactoylglutathione lyase